MNPTEELALMKTRIELLLKGVQERFLHPDPEVHGCAIVLALEGLKFLDGGESTVDDDFLRRFA